MVQGYVYQTTMFKEHQVVRCFLKGPLCIDTTITVIRSSTVLMGRQRYHVTLKLKLNKCKAWNHIRDIQFCFLLLSNYCTPWVFLRPKLSTHLRWRICFYVGLCRKRNSKRDYFTAIVRAFCNSYNWKNANTDYLLFY